MATPATAKGVWLVPTVLALLALAGKGGSVHQVDSTTADGCPSLQAGLAACA